MTLKEETNSLVTANNELTLKTIDWLNNNINKNFLVFEWGASSTTFWLSSKVNKVYTHEYSERFFYYVKEIILTENYKNISLKLAPYDKYIEDDFLDHTDNNSYKNYITSIEDYPSQIFDLICIKEKCITKALEYAIENSKSGTILLFSGKIDKRLLLENSSYFSFTKTFTQSNLENTVCILR